MTEDGMDRLEILFQLQTRIMHRLETTTDLEVILDVQRETKEFMAMLRTMSKQVPMVLAILMIMSCGGIVRDGNTYRNELAFSEALLLNLADSQLAQAAIAAKVPDLGRCESLAENALVAKYRATFHKEKSLFLAGLSEDPGPAPPVPESKKWCLDTFNGGAP